MQSEGNKVVEARTQELPRQLYQLMREYRPPLRERQQDWLMDQMARDAVLESRLLRFVDVLAALDADANRNHIKGLFQDYFSGQFPGCSSLLRLILFVCRQPATPAGLVSVLSRGAMQALSSRFIARPDYPAILDILAYLERQGRYSTIALLGEDVLSEHEAELFKARYLQLVDRLARHCEAGRHAPALQLSIKLTSLTDNFNPADREGTLGRVRKRLEEIAQSCVSNGIGLTIDAELYEHREITWYIFSEVFGPRSSFNRWDGAGITIQSYFKDSENYLQTVIDFAKQRQAPLQVRLAKGAYWNLEVITAHQNHWPVPVFEQKNDTNMAFHNMFATLLRESRHVSVAVAGHNIIDHARTEALRESLGLAEGMVEHQTLFRTAEGVSRALKRMGWVTRDYVPSGELVPGMAYLVRRVQENTSPEGFLMRSRSGESVAELSRTTSEAARPAVQDKADEGFHNRPPKRIFLSIERSTFEAALKANLSQWGQDYPLELGGQTVETQELKISVSPSSPDQLKSVGHVHMAGLADAEQAISIVRKGFIHWSATSAQERARILLKVATRLAEERDTLAAWIVHEGGRIWVEALADVDEAADHFAYNANCLLVHERRVEEHYQPRGVVAVIAPWNFPAALPSGMISGALAAGNTVVLKSAEQTPIIAARLVKILHSAGVPEDVLLHLPGWGEVVGDYLVRSHGVDMVAFTGSKAVGLGINKKATSTRLSSGLKKVVVEMGGKNAIIVFADADLDEAVKGILLSTFEHANQKCSACSRVFVHRSIFKHLSERLIHAATSLPVGPADEPGTLVNPLIEQEARERVLAYAEKARSEGKILVDRISTGSSNPLQVGPLVVELELARLSQSAIAREEIFGPILVLVPFEDENEMLAEINGTAYALTSGIFSRSPRTVARMLREVRAGNIYVNRKITGARVGVEPFGGFQLSGTGPKAGGPDYLFAFLTRKHGIPHHSRVPTPGLPMPPLAATVEPWSINAMGRRDVLRRAVSLLDKDFREELSRAVSAASTVPDARERMAKELVNLAKAVVESAAEIAEAEATIAMPGQNNFIDWATPRGVGFVATDNDTGADRFAGMVFGPLLAGNGLILAPSANLKAMAAVLMSALYRAGVPRRVLGVAPYGGPEAAVLLADDMFQFAVTDMALEETFHVYERLGQTREDKGQRWVKTLISMQEGHCPGEPGFVRQFALPKTIAIRTLRHSADLELPFTPV
ncbi:MAG: proline dehydrogenase family protein [Chloroflexi bacterium]|nr:proline dehydrogenase family protein [Chloroflexota bacterium]